MSREWALAWLGWLAVVLGLAAAGAWAYQSWELPQPVPFNHKKHVDWGIACESCHTGAREEAKAGIPGTRVCAMCHQPGRAEPKTPPELAERIAADSDIPWRRLYRVPPHVLFSHKRHVEFGRVDCSTCHGDVARTERALGRRAVPLKMELCMDCHRREKVTTDCIACHR